MTQAPNFFKQKNCQFWDFQFNICWDLRFSKKTLCPLIILILEKFWHFCILKKIATWGIEFARWRFFWIFDFCIFYAKIKLSMSIGRAWFWSKNNTKTTLVGIWLNRFQTQLTIESLCLISCPSVRSSVCPPVYHFVHPLVRQSVPYYFQMTKTLFPIFWSQPNSTRTKRQSRIILD